METSANVLMRDLQSIVADANCVVKSVLSSARSVVSHYAWVALVNLVVGKFPHFCYTKEEKIDDCSGFYRFILFI